MIARGFKPVVWVAAVGTAALGCYMLSLRVAAERAELAGLEREIVSTQQQIRSLQTELGTRGRVQQLAAVERRGAGAGGAGLRPVSAQAESCSPASKRASPRSPTRPRSRWPRPKFRPLPLRAAPAAVRPQRAVAAAPAAAAPLAPAGDGPARQPDRARRAPARPSAPSRSAPRRGRRPPAGPARPAAHGERRARARPHRAAGAPGRPAPPPGRPPRRPRPVRRPRPRCSTSARSRDLGSAARAERGGGTRN